LILLTVVFRSERREVRSLTWHTFSDVSALGHCLNKVRALIHLLRESVAERAYFRDP
jgi:hypothetical protein